MKEFLKKLLLPTVEAVINKAYKKEYHKDYSPFYLLRFVLRQKFFGANRKIPWPVHHTSVIKAYENIMPGNKAPGMGIYCYIDGRNGINIGENVWIAPHVYIISMNHDPINYKKYIKDKPIKIGKNSLLSANCTILPGVELGEHTIVAAGAVVSKSFPQGNVLIGGIPAKVIKELPPYREE